MLDEYKRHVILEADSDLEESSKNVTMNLNFSGIRDSSNKKSKSKIHRSFYVDSDADNHSSNDTVPFDQEFYLQDIAESENEGTLKHSSKHSP